MSRLHTLLAASLIASTFAACGGNDQTGPAGAASPGTPATTAASAPAAPAVHDGRKIDVTADDSMKFSTVEVRATAGERLSLTLTNTGLAPKFSMGHNWVLLTSAADVTAFLGAAGESPTTDYLPAAKRAEILAATKLLGPGESDTVTFDAPTEPGRYTFLCSFPGHGQVGMRGVLIVS